MPLAFRNLDLTPDDPVETWPLEAVITALERGGLAHRRRLAAAIRADPWGPVAHTVGEALAISSLPGTGPLMATVIADARSAARDDERTQVAHEVRSLVGRSGLTAAEFARRCGTSASRLSTYSSGRVVPSASLMVRMRLVAARASGSDVDSG